MLSPKLSLHMHLTFFQQKDLKLLVLVAAARLRREGLQHGAAGEAEGARRLGRVEAIAVAAKVPVRRQVMAE